MAGSGNPALNSFVFASGSWSGAAALRVETVNQFANVDGQLVGPGFFTVDDGRLGTVGQGDSGGPVGATTANPNAVVARGMIDAIDPTTLAACNGMTGRQCAWRSFHVNITQIATALGFTILTQ